MKDELKTQGISGTFAFAFLESQDPTVVRVALDGPIGMRMEEADGTFYGATASSFLNEVQERLADVEGIETVEVDLNSPGGIFNDAVAIATGLQSLGLRVRFRTVSLSASAAAYLAVLGDEHLIAEDASMMIHQASGGVYGSAAKIRSYAESVEQTNATMVKRLSEKSGKDEDEIAALIDGKDYWMTGLDAVAMGFADGLIEPLGITACATPEDLAALNAPEELAAKVAEAAEAEAEAEDAEDAEADAGETTSVEDAPEEEEFTAEQEAAVRAACEALEASDRAEEFISARASVADVRRAVYAARAKKADATGIDPTAPPAGSPADPDAASLHKSRQSVFAHLNSKKV